MRTLLSKRAQRGVIAALALTLVSSVQGQPATFAPADLYTVGSTTYSGAAGDLDGDGNLDLVVVNFSDRTASVLLGTGDGTFGAATTLALGDPGDIDNAVRAVSLGDVDGDGDLDAVATGDPGRIFTLLGAGDGTFPTVLESTSSAGGNAYEVALASLDADGDLDLVLAGSSNLIVFDGDGAGGFTPVSFIDLGNSFVQQTGLAVGDFDGDTWPDVAAGNGDDAVIVALNDGTGGFPSPTFYYNDHNPARDLVAADLDGDTDLDLATTHGGDGEILLNDGTGVFGAATYFLGPSISWSIDAADVNLDGKVDLLLGAGSSGVSVVRGQGDGTFLPDEDYTTGLATTYGVTAADFDGDMKPDFVATDVGTAATDGRIAVRLNTTEAPVTELNLFVTESILVSDAPGVLPALMLAVQETVGVTDDPTLLLALLLAVQETIAVTDDPALLPAMLLRIEEQIGVTDQPDLLLPLLLAVQETIGVSDQPNLLPALLLAISERIGVADGPALTPALLLAIRETIAVSDDPDLAAALLLLVEERITVSDTFGRLLGADALIDALEASVADLFSEEAIDQGQAKSLLRKLDQVRKHVQRERYSLALNVLDAFVNQVESFHEEDLLIDEQADALLAQAQALTSAIDQLMEPASIAAEASENASKSEALPTEFSLAPAYPNPFQSRTIIPYALPEATHVRLEVFDALGRSVSVLINGEQEAGHYAASFVDSGLASGVYLYQLTAGSFVQAHTMTLVK